MRLLRQQRHILLAIFILLGAALRLVSLGGRSLWLDEIFTAVFVSPDQPLANVFQYALGTPIPAPPLWFIVIHGFTSVLGASEFVLRLPSALIGILAIALIYRAGTVLFGRTEGVIAAFFLAVSPYHLYYSREARYYAALTFFSLVTMVFLYLAVRRRQWRWWLAFAAVSVVNVYTHLTAFFVLLAEMVFVGSIWLWRQIVLDEPPEERAGAPPPGGKKKEGHLLLAQAVFSAVIVLLSYIPMWPYVIQGILGPRGLGSPEGTEKLDVSVPFFIQTFSLFGAGTGLAFALFMGAFLWGIIASAPARRRQIVLVLAWVVIPLAVIIIARPKHFFDPKYLIYILPVYLIGVAAGIADVGRSLGDVALSWPGGKKGRAAALIGVAAIVAIFTAFNITAVKNVYRATPDDWGDVGQFLRQNVTSEDIIVTLPVAFVTLPVDEVMAYYGPPPDQAEVLVTASVDQLEAAFASHRRLWLVSSHYAWANRPGDITQWIRSRDKVELEFDQGFRVVVMGRGMSRDTLLAEAMHYHIPESNVWGSLGNTLNATGQTTSAITAYQQAIGLAPKEAIWHARLGHLYYEQGQSEQAVAEYRQAVKLEPETPGFHSDLAEVLYVAGDRDGALAEYKSALRLYLQQRRGTEDAPYVQGLKRTIAQIEEE